MTIHKTARDFALKHHLNLGRLYNGHYYMFGVDGRRLSLYPTAKSAINLMKRELKDRSFVAGR